jgi:predicted Zn finger-like uncharacterized protein
MIIECQACRARFKLDESRIKGKGARIRCRKCGESIIVMKSDIPPTPPSPPAAKDLFDLRAILDAPETKAARSSRDEVDAAFDKIFSAEPETGPVASREEKVTAPPEEKAPEEFAQKPAEPREAPTLLSREEIDTAFDELLREDREPETISPKSPESALPREEFDAAFDRPLFPEADSVRPPSPEADFKPPSHPEMEEPVPDRGSPDASFPREPEKEEKPVLPEKSEEIGPPDRSIEDLFRTPQPAEEGPEPAREPLGPLELDESSSEYLRMNGVDAEPERPHDISERLEEAPLWLSGGEMPSAPLEPETIPHFEEAPSPRMEAIHDELADLAEKRRMQEEARGLASPPPAPPPPSPPQIPPLETLSPKFPEIERAPAARRRPPARSRRPLITLLVLLLIALAGGGVYLTFFDSGRDSLHAIFSALGYFRSGEKEPVQPFKVKNLAGFYDTGGKAGERFVVHGVITSQEPRKISGIRVRAELFDKNKQMIAEKTAYAGNIIPALNSVDRETIETAMANRFGDKLSNVDIPPGHSVPFMVVFFDPPQGIEEYRVEALKGEE